MEKWWFNSMLFKKGFGCRCGLNKPMDSLGSIENTSESDDPNRKDTSKSIQGRGGRHDYSYSKGEPLFVVKDIRNFLPDGTLLVKDSKGDLFFIYFDIENPNSSYLNDGATIDDTYSNRFLYDTQYSWNTHINSCIYNYLQSQIGIDMSIVSSSENYSDSYIYSSIYGEIRKNSKGEGSDIRTRATGSDFTLSLRESSNDHDESSNDHNEISNDHNESSNDHNESSNDFSHLWVLCENCYGFNYKEFFKSKMYICEYCGDHLKMSSSDRIELSIDPGTWDPMDEDMISPDPDPIGWDSIEEEEEPSKDPIEFDSIEEEEPSKDPIEFDSIEEEEPYPYPLTTTFLDHIGYTGFASREEEEPSKDPIEFDSIEEEEPYEDPIEFDWIEDDKPYKDRIDSYQIETGLTEAVQTGIGQLNGIPVAVGIMDFQFIGGSMGSVVGEKITRLIEYATNKFLPLIIVCASGGARMQEGALSLMQMAKISSALYDYQSNKKLFYVSILTSPTTGGVLASFGMLGDIIIAEPNALIAFTGKRVIEETLKITIPEGVQVAEYQFEKGLVDLIVPRNILKNVLSELFAFHAFLPLNQNSTTN